MDGRPLRTRLGQRPPRRIQAQRAVHPRNQVALIPSHDSRVIEGHMIDGHVRLQLHAPTQPDRKVDLACCSLFSLYPSSCSSSSLPAPFAVPPKDGLSSKPIDCLPVLRRRNRARSRIDGRSTLSLPAHPHLPIVLPARLAHRGPLPIGIRYSVHRGAPEYPRWRNSQGFRNAAAGAQREGDRERCYSQ